MFNLLITTDNGGLQCVKSSKIVVSIKIIIRTIKIKVPKKQLVYDQIWDIQAQTIVHEIGYYQ